MLPGVELARKRRVHHHGETAPSVGPPENSLRRPLSERAAGVINEPVLVARRRLDERLRCLDASSRNYPSPTSSHSRFLSRWKRHVVGEGEQPQKTKEVDAREGVLHRKDSGIDLCAVCLDEVKVEPQRRIMWLPCSHKYHSDCVRPWLAAHSQCPCCRTIVPHSNLLSGEVL